MPLDPSIISRGIQPVQPVDPMQTLAQISAMRNQALQREEAQQRIQLGTDELARRQALDAEKQKEHQRALTASTMLAPGQLGLITPDQMNEALDKIPDPELKAVAINGWQAFQKDSADIKIKEATAGHTTEETKKLRNQAFAKLVTPIATVYEYAPDKIDGAFHMAAATDVVDKKVLDFYYDQWNKSGRDPAVGKQLIDGIIQSGTEPVKLSRDEDLVSLTGQKLAQGQQSPPPKPTEFENFIMEPYAKMLGKAPFKTPGEAWAGLTSQEIDRAKEIMRADQRTSITIQNQQQAEKAWGDLDPDVRLTASRAINNLSGKRPDYWKKTILDAHNAGKDDEIPGMIQQAAIESESVAGQEKIRGRQNMVAGMQQIAEALKKVPQNYLRGTAEETARALGTSTNPEYVRLKGLIDANLATYRQGVTGAAFSAAEAKEYAKRFPNYFNDLPTNMAVIQGFLDNTNTVDRVYWETKLGKGGAKLVGIKPVDVLAKPAGNQGNTGKVENWVVGPDGKLQRQ